MTAAALAAAVDGVIVGDPDAVVTSFAIDSRDLEPGACFVALRGVRDGHDFAADAFARGATVALVAREVDHPAAAALVVVDDPLGALARAAAHTRAAWTDVTVVGITGSVGKTSTKDLTAAALGGARRVHASRGSFNNESGLPLTLLHTPGGTEVVIAEMGARFPGNIADLCLVARPSVGVVTRVGLAHAAHLGGPAGILETKGELVEALPASGTAVLNADDPASPALAARTAARVLTVGRRPDADVVVGEIVLDRDLRPRFALASPWGTVEVALAVRGEHQAQNAAMAATVGLVLGVAPESVAAGLARAETASGRMELATSPGGVVVINDAYNANPDSVRAALASLRAYRPTGRRVAVLGDMLELGGHAEAEHAAVADLAATAGVDLLVAVGPHSAVTAAHAARAGIETLHAADRDEARALVTARVRPGDAVLLKASRGIGLETVADALARGEADR
ncbi:MAG: UDP-N-acetylmuramoyl-tripeptide--D-alanyl-D-alanine ligase [Actinobacteria bacterium]|nr:UDP-N-acetylmuramoyl-tripeptide--D-alanyl-D-alanine ligase [Actinomycetota bacterium]